MGIKAATLLTAGFLAVLLVMTSAPADAADGGGVVQCYNEALGTVQATLASDCKDRVVGEEEAAAIRKKRRAYIQKVLSGPPGSPVQGKQLAGTGSGFFVAEDGSVVTSRHVIEDCAAVSISPTFGEMVFATSIVPDEKTDLALLRADVVPPAVAPLAAAGDLALLSPAYVTGYPNRGLVAIEPILTPVDILQQKSQTDRGPAIVVRGDIRQGNSGGPLLDSGGGVLGVVFGKVDSVNTYQATGEIINNIGLALQGDVLKGFLESNNVDFRLSARGSIQPAGLILDDARPFLVQVGCWR